MNSDAMKPNGITRYLGYSVAFISLCAGVVFLTGVFLPPTLPLQLRLMVGVVFVLMSVYRFVATKYKIREQERMGQ